MLSPSPTPVLLVEDEANYRNIIGKQINSLEDFNVQAQLGNGQELIHYLEQHDFAGIIIMDIRMPVLNGYLTLPVLQEKWPEIKVLVLSMYGMDFTVKYMLQHGAAGFLVKQPKLPLYQALTSIRDTGIFYSDVASELMFKQALNEETVKITAREMEFCPARVSVFGTRAHQGETA